MRTLFYLSESQLKRIKPFFPRFHGVPRVRQTRRQRYHIRHQARTSVVHLMSTARTKRCTIGLPGKTVSVFFNKNSMCW